MDIYVRIREFYDTLETNPLTSSQIALWFALLHTNNKARWAEWFSVASSVLTSRTGLDRKGINRARNTLKQKGYIDFKTNGNNATSYTVRYARIGMANDMASDMAGGRSGDRADGRSGDMAGDMAGDRAEENSYITSRARKTNTKTKTKTVNPLNPLFDRFWEAYPKKVAKEVARKAFEKVSPDEVLLAVILKAIDAQKSTAQWTKDNGEFIPHPSTWLNQARWEDKVQPGGKRVGFQAYDQGTDTDFVGIDLLAEARAASDWREQ